MQPYRSSKIYISSSQFVCLCRFFTWYATLFCIQLYSSTIYRLIGSAVRAIVSGTSVAAIFMNVTFTGTGFVLLQRQIPPYWIWMFWLSPLQVWVLFHKIHALYISPPIVSAQTGQNTGMELTALCDKAGALRSQF